MLKPEIENVVSSSISMPLLFYAVREIRKGSKNIAVCILFVVVVYKQYVSHVGIV